MKYIWLLLLLGLASWTLKAQTPEDFQIEIDPALTFSGVPGIHAYSYAVYEGKWIIMGGKITGLHDHRPPFSFAANTANRTIYVIDPVAEQIWSAPVTSLRQEIETQLGCTNLQFFQDDSTFYLIGGYGWDSLQQNIYTHPRLTAVNLAGLTAAIMGGSTDLSPYFRQITDQRMAVTGGHLTRLGDTYHLVWGNKFDGRYNPMNMPTFTQVYTKEIRKFKIQDDGINLAITDYQAIQDTNNFRRRDYNLVPQVFQGGRPGFTGFTGVFRSDIDLPYLDIVEIDSTGYRVRNDFEQLLNQYHSAFLPAYDSAADAMHTFFFGGIAHYYYGDPDNTLYVDSLVPFVKTISQVTRFANDSMVEYNLPIEMPGYLGSSTELIPNPDAPFYIDGVIDLNKLPAGKHLVGYIYGGIEASGPYVFRFAGTSTAYNGIIKVYISKTSSSGLTEDEKHAFSFSCSPNPGGEILTLNYQLNVPTGLDITLSDLEGRTVDHWTLPLQAPGAYKARRDLSQVADGVYFCTIKAGGVVKTHKVVLRK